MELLHVTNSNDRRLDKSDKFESCFERQRTTSCDGSQESGLGSDSDSANSCDPTIPSSIDHVMQACGDVIIGQHPDDRPSWHSLASQLTRDIPLDVVRNTYIIPPPPDYQTDGVTQPEIDTGNRSTDRKSSSRRLPEIPSSDTARCPALRATSEDATKLNGSDVISRVDTPTRIDDHVTVDTSSPYRDGEVFTASTFPRSRVKHQTLSSPGDVADHGGRVKDRGVEVASRTGSLDRNGERQRVPDRGSGARPASTVPRATDALWQYEGPSPVSVTKDRPTSAKTTRTVLLDVFGRLRKSGGGMTDDVADIRRGDYLSASTSVSGAHVPAATVHPGLSIESLSEMAKRGSIAAQPERRHDGGLQTFHGHVAPMRWVESSHVISTVRRPATAEDEEIPHIDRRHHHHHQQPPQTSLHADVIASSSSHVTNEENWLQQHIQKQKQTKVETRTTPRNPAKTTNSRPEVAHHDVINSPIYPKVDVIERAVTVTTSDSDVMMKLSERLSPEGTPKSASNRVAEYDVTRQGDQLTELMADFRATADNQRRPYQLSHQVMTSSHLAGKANLLERRHAGEKMKLMIKQLNSKQAQLHSPSSPLSAVTTAGGVVCLTATPIRVTSDRPDVDVYRQTSVTPVSNLKSGEVELYRSQQGGATSCFDVGDDDVIDCTGPEVVLRTPTRRKDEFFVHTSPHSSCPGLSNTELSRAAGVATPLTPRQLAFEAGLRECGPNQQPQFGVADIVASERVHHSSLSTSAGGRVLPPSYVSALPRRPQTSLGAPEVVSKFPDHVNRQDSAPVPDHAQMSLPRHVESRRDVEHARSPVFASQRQNPATRSKSAVPFSIKSPWNKDSRRRASEQTVDVEVMPTADFHVGGTNSLTRPKFARRVENWFRRSTPTKSDRIKTPDAEQKDRTGTASQRTERKWYSPKKNPSRKTYNNVDTAVFMNPSGHPVSSASPRVVHPASVSPLKNGASNPVREPTPSRASATSPATRGASRRLHLDVERARASNVAVAQSASPETCSTSGYSSLTSNKSAPVQLTRLTLNLNNVEHAIRYRQYRGRGAADIAITDIDQLMSAGMRPTTPANGPEVDRHDSDEAVADGGSEETEVVDVVRTPTSATRSFRRAELIPVLRKFVVACLDLNEAATRYEVADKFDECLTTSVHALVSVLAVSRRSMYSQHDREVLAVRLSDVVEAFRSMVEAAGRALKRPRDCEDVANATQKTEVLADKLGSLISTVKSLNGQTVLPLTAYF